MGAYLGKTNIWLSNDDAVPASFITLLRANSHVDAAYLFCFLNSPLGIHQSKAFQSGTSQQYIYPKDIRQMLVPEVKQEAREEIDRLIVESYQAEEESKRLLDQAKHRVETLIEEAIAA